MNMGVRMLVIIIMVMVMRSVGRAGMVPVAPVVHWAMGMPVLMLMFMLVRMTMAK